MPQEHVRPIANETATSRWRAFAVALYDFSAQAFSRVLGTGPKPEKQTIKTVNYGPYLRSQEIDFSPPDGDAPSLLRIPQRKSGNDSKASILDTIKPVTPHSKTMIRIKLAATILCIYLALNTAAAVMFLGKQFVEHFIWISCAWGFFLVPLDVWFAKKSQKRFFRRIHRIVYAKDELTLQPGELPAIRRSVVALPWLATARETLAYIVANLAYSFVVVRSYALYTHDAMFYGDAAYWFKVFVMVTIPVVPIVLITALLTFSAATRSYVQFFFRRGEFEQHRWALTDDRRRYLYVSLIGYTLFLIIMALNYSLTSNTFSSINAVLETAKETANVGLYLIIVLIGLLFTLARQEQKTQGKMPPALEARAHSVTPIDKRCPKCQMVVGFGIDICPQDGTPLNFSGDESSFGTTYEFIEELARGGMCVIYKARHRLMKKVVAIKMLDTRYVSNDQAVERFAHEARAVSRLAHPNIVSVYDFGQFESHKLFLVMEYLSGKSLGDLISDSRSGLPVADCQMIFTAICDAMAYAHAHKILHRDLKPSNIMVSHDGERVSIKVVDFGIAKVLEGTGNANLTKTGDVFGTPDYMSPEQCLGNSLDERSDIYSMGCLMYEILTGHRPACSENPMATMYKQINEVAAPPHAFRPELGKYPALEATVLRALSKEPNQRQSSFAELAGEICAATAFRSDVGANQKA